MRTTQTVTAHEAFTCYFASLEAMIIYFFPLPGREVKAAQRRWYLRLVFRVSLQKRTEGASLGNGMGFGVHFG